MRGKLRAGSRRICGRTSTY